MARVAGFTELSVTVTIGTNKKHKPRKEVKKKYDCSRDRFASRHCIYRQALRACAHYGFLLNPPTEREWESREREQRKMHPTAPSSSRVLMLYWLQMCRTFIWDPRPPPSLPCTNGRILFVVDGVHPATSSCSGRQLPSVCRPMERHFALLPLHWLVVDS